MNAQAYADLLENNLLVYAKELHVDNWMFQ